MNITNRLIAEIKPYGKNAKKHPDKQIKQVAASIEAFGFNQPIVVDKDDVIIVGHGRFGAAHYLGLTEVPVLTVDLNEEQAKAYRLADNKLNESEWDMQLVIQELKGLEVNLVDLTGFSRSLLYKTSVDDDSVPAIPTNPKTVQGDLYQLGPHFLLCGDSTKAEDLTRLMANHKADMIFTDPPYNVNYHGSGEKTSQGIMNDKMGDAQFLAFLTDAFKAVRPVFKAGGGAYVFHSSTTQATFEQALRTNDFEIRSQLIWNKPSGGLGMGDYRTKHEPFFYCGIKGTSPNFYGDRTNTSIVDFQKTDAQLLAWAKRQKQAEKDGKTTVWTMKREPVQSYVHPTQKPVELIMYALANSSKVEDIVLDPFSGSGSTLIACHKTNRVSYGLELDPAFMDVIITRWVEYTGNREIKKNGEPITW